MRPVGGARAVPGDETPGDETPFGEPGPPEGRARGTGAVAATLHAMRRARREASGSGVLAALAMAVVLAACVPSESTGLHEVDDGSDRVGTTVVAPTFPVIGRVSEAAVIEGVTYDLSARPRDQDYWSPSSTEARCAAETIVADLGADRLVSLGYRPGTPGAALNDIELDDAERDRIVEGFSGCVDLVEAFAAVLYGDGRMPPKAATCVARGMGEAGARPLVEAWVSGDAVEPFEDSFATLLMGHAQVCIDPTAFNWSDLRLPDDDSLIDSDVPAGSRRSSHPDDHRRADSPDSQAPNGDPSAGDPSGSESPDSESPDAAP